MCSIFKKKQSELDREFIEKHKASLLRWYKFRLDTIQEAVNVMNDEQLLKAIRKLFS